MARTLLDRFLQYVQFDTQSAHESDKMPSTPQQWDLLRALEQELHQLGAADISLNSDGYLLASIPGSPDVAAPPIGFLAHIDTSPDFSGKGVKPIVHRDYQGQEIVLPDDPRQVLSPANSPDLREKVGRTIVTASGTTLLGADDKAGVAVIMTLAERLLKQPEIRRPPIRICFNPDEEVGQGMSRLKIADLGAHCAYTLDAGQLGEIEYETFSADEARVDITGVSIHPGSAKGKMVNAIQLAAKLLAFLPREGLSPETTEGREGFLHPHGITGTAAKAELTFILRDYEREGLAEKGRILQAACRALQDIEPRAAGSCSIKPQYRNMRYWLEKDLRPVRYVEQAMKNAGVAPLNRSVRGGTDGSRLTEMGIPTPNIFCGAHNLHGPLEWVCAEDMERSVDVLVELVQIWAGANAADSEKV